MKRFRRRRPAPVKKGLKAAGQEEAVEGRSMAPPALQLKSQAPIQREEPEGEKEPPSNKSVSPDIDNNKVGAKVESKKSQGDHGEDAKSAGVALEGDKVTLSGGTSNTIKYDGDEEGPSDKKSLDGSVSVDEKGNVSGSAKMGSSSKDGGGNTTDKSAAVSFDGKEGKVGADGTWSKEDKDGKKREVSGGGKVNFREDGQIEGVEGNLGAGTTHVTIALGGEYSAIIAKPVKKGKQWSVTYTITKKGSVAIGGRGGKVENFQGKSGSVTGSYAGSVVDSGTRLFDSYEAAQSFYKTGSGLQDRTRALKEGETRQHSESDEVGVGGNVNVEGIQVGANVKWGSTESTKETGGKDNTVIVEVSVSDVFAANATAGNLLTMKFGYQSTDTDTVKVLFDLKKPAQKAAYEQFQKSGKLPAQGYTLQATKKATTKSTSSGVGLLGASASNTSTVGETTTKDEKGKVIKREHTGEEGDSVTVPFVGHHKDSTKLTGEVDYESGKKSWNVASEVDSTYASDATKALADATDSHYNTEAEGKASGKWSVTASVPTATMDKFITRVESGKFTGKYTSPRDIGHMEDFQEKLAQAKSQEEKRRLVVEYVSQAGNSAIENIEHVGGGKLDRQVSLAKDPYLTGAAGNAKTEAEIKRLAAKLRSGKDRKGVLKEIRIALSHQRQRKAALANLNNYPELPMQVRKAEINRSSRYISQLTSLEAQAKPPAKTKAHEAREEKEQASLPQNKSYEPTEEDKQQKRLEEAVAHLNMQRSLCGKRAAMCDWHYKAHTGSWSMVDASKKLGGEGIFGSSVGQGAEHGNYAAAKSSRQLGHSLRQKAEALYAEHNLVDDPDTITARAHIASRAFVDARNKFDHAIGIYAAIFARHKSTTPGYFQGYERNAKPAE